MTSKVAKQRVALTYKFHPASLVARDGSWCIDGVPVCLPFKAARLSTTAAFTTVGDIFPAQPMPCATLPSKPWSECRSYPSRYRAHPCCRRPCAGEVKMVDLLLEARASTKMVTTDTQSSCLHIAAKNNAVRACAQPEINHNGISFPLLPSPGYRCRYRRIGGC